MKSVLTIIFLFTTVQCAPEFTERARNFSMNLLYNTGLQTDGHNINISPFGVWSLMTAITLGATGRSRKQLAEALVLPDSQLLLIQGYVNLTNTIWQNTNGVTLTSKNFMFLDTNFQIQPNFRKVMTSYFGAAVEQLDFSDMDTAAKTANTIIKQSGASVSDVLRPDDFTHAAMIVTNVISFKGLWSWPFDTKDTTVEPFYNENKIEIGKVNMMHRKAEFAYSNIKEINAVVLELPYGDDGKYCMLVILPYPKIKVSDVYKKLATTSYPEIFARLQRDIDEFDLVEVSVKLPRFRISTNILMDNPLNSMGVYDIFDPRRASFEGVTKKGIFVSAIIHKTDIEVTESGTIASASSSAIFADRISAPNFHANRPFIYSVMYKPSATVMFSGVYYNPSVY